jgi:hypothetical protein
MRKWKNVHEQKQKYQGNWIYRWLEERHYEKDIIVGSNISGSQQ